MQTIFKTIILSVLLIVPFISQLFAKDIDQSVGITIIGHGEESFVHEKDRSKTIFKDISPSFYLFKSHDTSISIDTIAAHEKAFVPFSKEELFQDKNVSYWLKIDIGAFFPDGDYISSYGDATIIADTFSSEQKVEYISIHGSNQMKFSYQQSRDKRVYYFKLKPRHFRVPYKYFYISSSKVYYNDIWESFNIFLLRGIILGIIFMAAIYNGAIYYYNRKKSFFYYMAMQLFMLALFYQNIGLFNFDESSFFSRNLMYNNLLSLGTALFATLFTLTFLDIKTTLPRLYPLFQVMLVLLGIDILLTLIDTSYFRKYYLYTFLMFPLIYAGVKRLKQGYKPAYFYLIGWVLLTIAIFLTMFQIGIEFFIIHPLYIGSALEAIFFSLALSYKMRMIATEKEAQKEMLVHQSKLASMGEMIGNIAHQWRQPLTHLSYTFMNIQESHTHQELSTEYLQEKINEANKQIDFMSQTIDDFKDFYQPHKDKECFSLIEVVEESLEIMQHTLNKSQIEIKVQYTQEGQLTNYKNECKQVILNLLSNAKDACIEREIKSPKINIEITDNRIILIDNAGGIDKDILSRIYEPYFTTKEDSSGIGLYMSKMIIEKNMGGELEISNSSQGVKCELKF